MHLIILFATPATVGASAADATITDLAFTAIAAHSRIVRVTAIAAGVSSTVLLAAAPLGALTLLLFLLMLLLLVARDVCDGPA